MPTPTPARLFHRDFNLYLVGIAASAVGDALAYIALPFLVLGLGEGAGGAGTLATVLLLASLPRLAGPLVGALADRLPLRLPLLSGALARAALFAGLGLLAGGGHLGLWMLYVAAPANALLTIFTFAAGTVVVPKLVPPARLAQANSLMQAATMGLPLVGLGAAGALVATVGAGGTLLVAAPFMLALAACVVAVRFPAPAATEGRSLAGDLATGLAYVARRPLLHLLLVGSLVINAALNLINVLMPVLMEGSGAGPRGYGLFEALLSAGTLVGIAAVTVLSARVPSRWLVSLSHATSVTGFLVLAGGTLARWWGGAVVVGVGLGIGEVAILTLVQLLVPDGLRGKVLGLALPANAAGLALGAAAAGFAGAHEGTSLAFVLAAALIALLGITWLTATRRLALGSAAGAAT